MRVVPAEARHFLFQPRAGTGHQIPIAAAPLFVAVRERQRHAPAVRFECVLPDHFRGQRRQFTVPVHDMGGTLKGCRHRVSPVAVPENRRRLPLTRRLCKSAAGQGTCT